MKTLIRLPNWIGDAVMATPMVRAVAASQETESLAVWGPPKVAALFHGFPGVERVLEIDPKKEPERLEEIRCVVFDRVYLLPNSFSSAREARDLGIPERIGYRTQWRGGLLTRPIRLTRRIRSFRMAEYYLNLLPDRLRELSGGPAPSLFVLPEERAAASARLEMLGDGAAELIGLAPGAAFGPAKQWFIPNFRELAERLSNVGKRVVIVGGPDDRDAGEEIIADLPNGQVRNLAGETSLRQMMALIEQCRLLVTNDSGPMHVADALGTPTAAIFGSTDSTWTGPRRPNHEVLQSDVACNPCFLRECPIGYDCMRGITVDRVHKAVLSILDRGGKPNGMTSPDDPGDAGVR